MAPNSRSPQRRLLGRFVAKQGREPGERTASRCNPSLFPDREHFGLQNSVTCEIASINLKREILGRLSQPRAGNRFGLIVSPHLNHDVIGPKTEIPSAAQYSNKPAAQQSAVSAKTGRESTIAGID